MKPQLMVMAPHGLMKNAFLVLLGALVLLLVFPVLTYLTIRLGIDGLGSAGVLLLDDWGVRPMALMLVGALVGYLGGRGGGVLSMVAAAPAVLTKAVVYGTPMAVVVATFQLVLAGLAGLIGSWAARKASAARDH